MSRVRIGVAIGEGAVTAVVRLRAVVHRADEVLPAGAVDDAGALSVALKSAAARLEVLAGVSLDRARVHVALLPPLADARLVQLPPLRHAEAEGVLRRDAARHFVGGAVARVVAVAQPHARRRAEGGVPPVFAAASPLTVVEAVRGAVAAAGWRLDTIVPAQAAWLASLPAPRSSEVGTTASVLIAVQADAAHVIRREDGVITVVRRVPPTWREELLAAAGQSPGTAVVLALSAVREPLSRLLRTAGWTVDGGDPLDPAEAAALHAPAAALALVSPLLATAQRERQRWVAKRIVAAAVLLLVGAAALELWGTQRELDAVRARRAEIHDRVAPLLATRDSLARLDQRVATIRALDTDAPRWTRAIFDLALLLPPDARLTRVTTSGDTLYAEAAGARAGAALQALRDATSLRDVRLDGTVLRDLEGGETVVERFRVRARLAEPAAWSRPPRRPVSDSSMHIGRPQGHTADAPDAEPGPKPLVRRSM